MPARSIDIVWASSATSNAIDLSAFPNWIALKIIIPSSWNASTSLTFQAGVDSANLRNLYISGVQYTLTGIAASLCIGVPNAADLAGIPVLAIVSGIAGGATVSQNATGKLLLQTT